MARTIFPGLQLLKKEITERFLVATREIFRNHPVYSYQDNQEQTNILLYPSYADIDVPGKRPKMLFKTGGYEFQLNDTLYHDMTKETKNSMGLIAGYESSKFMNSSVSVMIRAYAEEESSDLADELASLVVFACRGMYSQVGIVVRGAQVLETDMVDKDNGVFQTNLIIPLDFVWQGNSVQESPAAEHHIHLITPKTKRETILDALPESDVDLSKLGFREPGVTSARKY